MTDEPSHSPVPVETGAEHVHVHPRHVGFRWLDLSIALTAIAISAISLGVAFEHGRTERELVASNAWPFLREFRSNGDLKDQQIGIGLSNGGVGPAKVRSLEVFYRGAPVGTPVELLRRCCGLGPDDASFRRQLPGGFNWAVADGIVLRPGELNVVFRLSKTPGNAAVYDRMNGAIREIRFRACYCSILDQCWRSDLRSIDPLPVKSCPAPAHPYRADGR